MRAMASSLHHNMPSIIHSLAQHSQQLLGQSVHVGTHNFVQQHRALANPFGEVPSRRIQALLVLVEHFKVKSLLQSQGNA